MNHTQLVLYKHLQVHFGAQKCQHTHNNARKKKTKRRYQKNNLPSSCLWKFGEGHELYCGKFHQTVYEICYAHRSCPKCKQLLLHIFAMPTLVPNDWSRGQFLSKERSGQVPRKQCGMKFHPVGCAMLNGDKVNFMHAGCPWKRVRSNKQSVLV